MGCCGGGHHQNKSNRTSDNSNEAGFNKAFIVFGGIALLSVLYYLVK